MARMEYPLQMCICISLLAHFLHVTALSSLPTSRRSVIQDRLLPMVSLMGATTCAPSQLAVAAETTPPLTKATTMLANPTGDAAIPNGVIWRTVSGQVLPATPSSLAEIMQTEVLGPISTASSGIVCISERHDDFEHHKVQLKVLMTMKKALTKRSQEQDVSEKLSIGMEMFQRQHQRYLDQFIAKTDYSIGDLQRDTNWDVTWGYDILHYLPILFFAKKSGIRILGLHPSDELVQQVEQQGLSSMAPFIDEVYTNDRDHAEDFRRLAMQRLSLTHFGCQEAMDAAIRKMYDVQCFREDYMAETAATQMARQPGGWVALLAGEQHILKRNGIPFRVLRRYSMKNVSPMSPSRGVFTILPKTIQFPIAAKDAPGIESADYVWYVQRDPSTEFQEDKVNNAPMRSV